MSASPFNKAVKTFDLDLLEVLVCPLSRTPLEYDADAQELISRAAGLAYPIKEGVAIMLIDEARKLPETLKP